jgi:putative transcriptional regulator
MTKKLSKITEALLETAEGMHRIGVMDDETYHKITVRHLGVEAPLGTKPISAKEIRRLRERAKLSQAALARSLNLSVGYISQLERGAKQPKGPALVLLNVIRRKGFEVIL